MYSILGSVWHLFFYNSIHEESRLVARCLFLDNNGVLYPARSSVRTSIHCLISFLNYPGNDTSLVGFKFDAHSSLHDQ